MSKKLYRDQSNNVVQNRVVYICGPSTPESQLAKRLDQMITTISEAIKLKSKPLSELIRTDNILLQKSSELKNLVFTLQNIKDKKIRNLKFLVVDSIGSYFRGQESDENIQNSDRNWKQEVGVLLVQIAEEFDIPILVINQVAEIIDIDASKYSYYTEIERKLGKRALLGLEWSRFISSRYFTSIDQNGNRVIQKAFSCNPSETEKVQFCITNSGIKTLELSGQKRKNVEKLASLF